eukprot:scaffold102929_cov47-Cyclotella_meneghiniana.AAC.1
MSGTQKQRMHSFTAITTLFIVRIKSTFRFSFAVKEWHPMIIVFRVLQSSASYAVWPYPAEAEAVAMSTRAKSGEDMLLSALSETCFSETWCWTVRDRCGWPPLDSSDLGSTP